jgi:AraC-like DNA-binding protein
MIVTTRFPDLPPRPETPVNASFRREYFARWGRENMVFLAGTRQFESMPQPAALSIKLIERGSATLQFRRRQVLLEPGQCIVVNEGEPYSVRISSDAPVQAYSLHFRPGLGAEVAAARRAGWDQALERGHEVVDAGTPRLRDELHAPSPALTQVLEAVRERVHEGERDGDAFEPLFIAALDHLFAADEALRRHAGRALGVVRPTTRAELVKRVGWAHDYIFSNYAEPITLDQIAAAARLSKYHLLRAFRNVYGATPHTLLQQRRAHAAARLLGDGEGDLAMVADAAGFGSRWAMQRALRRHCGETARALRAVAAARRGP